MVNFNEIYATLSAVPGLCDSIGMEKVMVFVRLVGRLKGAITVDQLPTHNATDAPEHLPDGIRTFLGSAIDQAFVVSDDRATTAWAAGI
ncbi:hypothetical protein B0H16DRAFT_769352 [Mycena metata]|uniref:Uncharacterized protein n=1 Tax=Mycena metata TaxID=1033252 RepID=A0AAD7IYZ1_9AGAR|nr:hypothetical protein B0H16DRAFT_769352 [Mycena metata]